MEFLLLGPVEVRAGGGSVAVGGTRTRCLLAALLLNVNRVVPIEQIIDAAWGDYPPAGARVQAQNRVSALRRVLHEAQPDRALITTSGSGYLIKLDDDQLDVGRFSRGVQRAAELAAAGQRQAARREVAAALALWRGPALDDLTTPYLRAAAQQLEEQRVRAVELRLQLDLYLGRHRELVAELTALIAAHPYRESLHAMLMQALYGADRQAEAHEAYHRARTTLAEQLGLDPSALLQRLHAAMLQGEASLEKAIVAGESLPGDSGIRPTDPPAAAERHVPAQLPLDVRGFTGRGTELAQLDALLATATTQPTAVLLIAITGTAGVGKTALAVHWAHHIADRFPDGQLYINLRGFDVSGLPTDPATVVRGFLDALDVPASRVPTDLDAQIALYRSRLAGRRLLVVLDNARDAEQVRPLLPGASGCVALITSRNRLSGLVATEGAHPVALHPLSVDEAHQLLRHRLGNDRVAAEPGAVRDIVAQTARLPLALVIVAARAATQPQQRLRSLADEIGTAGLVALTADDPAADLRTVFSWSFRALPPTAADLFRLLGAHAGPDFTVSAVASLIDASHDQAHASLGELLRAQLISEPTPGRYALHDLLRAYAIELVHTYDGEKELHLAQCRLLDHYLHIAYAATMLISPNRDRIDLLPPQSPVVPADLADRRQAMDWFAAEHRVLLAAIEQAAASGFDVHAWQLAWTTANVLHVRGQWHDMIAIHRIALDAAQRLADRAGEAHIHYGLGGAYARMARFDEAGPHYLRAIDLFREVDDRAGEATCHLGLGSVRQRQHQYRDALMHAQRAHELYQLQGHLAGQARVLNNIGWLYALGGEHRKALTHCGQALEAYRASGDVRGQAAALDSLAYAHHHLHEYREAVSLYRQAIEIFQEIGDRLNEAETLTRLGETLVVAGEPDPARDAWRLSLSIYRELERPDADEVRDRLATMGPANG